MDALKSSDSKLQQDAEGNKLDAKLDKDANPSRAPPKSSNESLDSSKAKATENNQQKCRGCCKHCE